MPSLQGTGDRLAEDVGRGDRDGGEKQWGEGVAPGDRADVAVPVGARSPVHGAGVGTEVHEPGVRDSAGGVAWHLEVAVALERRVGDSDDEEDVSGPRAPRAGETAGAPQ